MWEGNMQRESIIATSGYAENTVNLDTKSLILKNQKNQNKKKHTKNYQKINGKTGVENRRVPGPIFHRFWMDFGWILK